MSLHKNWSNKRDKVFSQCLDQAKQSNLLFRHGCIATYGGKIIAKGCNTYKNYSGNDIFLDRCCTCHAEMNVLRRIYHRYQKHGYGRHRRQQQKRKLSKIMKRTTLYISRYSPQQDASTNSAPCVDCMKMIHKFNIKKIVFHLNDEYFVLNARQYETDHRSVGQMSLVRRME